MKRIPLLACVLALSGCGIKLGLINDPPQYRDSGAPAKVTVYRAEVPTGFPFPMTFLINGIEIYGFLPGQSYSFLLDPGEYIFGYYLGLNSCRRHGYIDPGKTHVIRLAPLCVIERERAEYSDAIIQSFTIDLVNDEFDVDRATLKSGMKEALSQLARRVKESSGEERLTIIGHTDSTGATQHNYELGRRRALATRHYLVTVEGLDAARIETRSAGETDPVATNESQAGRSRNRRIEVRAELFRG